MIKMCSFYKSSRKCINKDYCIEQLPSDENCCTSNLYYCMDLEQQLQTAKEENEKLAQQNKQTRENIGKAEDIARTYQDYRPCLLIKKELQQAFKDIDK